MSIDINAFRLIANQSPDKFVYAQGDTLKASHSDTSHDAHTYRAATNAFLKACVDHYGSQMGSAIVRFLQDDIEGGKPLTARKIKALVEFADEKMGSATKVDVGGKEVELEKIGTDSMSRVGFSRESKIAKAKAGQQTSSAATLAAFKFGADGKVDLNAMLRHLFTFRAYIDREIDAHAVPKPSDVKRFEKWMFTAVDAMDNNELSAVYQGLISKQTDTFKKELVRIINHPDAKASVRTLAEQAFADISRIEVMVVSEISRRMILDRTPDAEKAGVPSLMQRYVAEPHAALRRRKRQPREPLRRRTRHVHRQPRDRGKQGREGVQPLEDGGREDGRDVQVARDGRGRFEEDRRHAARAGADDQHEVHHAHGLQPHGGKEAFPLQAP